MTKQTYCDICKRKKDCKIFTLRSNNSKAFDTIKKILQSDKNQLLICEEHYPSDAIKEKMTKGKMEKNLDKDVKDRVPTLNMPRSDPSDQISVIEHVNEESVNEQPENHINHPIENESNGV